jgi:hypothetical protein
VVGRCRGHADFRCKENPTATSEIVFPTRCRPRRVPSDIESLEFVDTAGRARDYQGRKTWCWSLPAVSKALSVLPNANVAVDYQLRAPDPQRRDSARHPALPATCRSFWRPFGCRLNNSNSPRCRFPFCSTRSGRRRSLWDSCRPGISRQLHFDKQDAWYAYVGRYLADRPSVRAMIDQLDLLEK